MVLFLVPVSNFQAFLGMSLIDKISMTVLVKDFFVFLFHHWSKRVNNFCPKIFFFLKKLAKKYSIVFLIDQLSFYLDIYYLKVYDEVVIVDLPWVDLHLNSFLLLLYLVVNFSLLLSVGWMKHCDNLDLLEHYFDLLVLAICWTNHDVSLK